jgi:hypothetical protein
MRRFRFAFTFISSDLAQALSDVQPHHSSGSPAPPCEDGSTTGTRTLCSQTAHRAYSQRDEFQLFRFSVFLRANGTLCRIQCPLRTDLQAVDIIRAEQ